MTDTQTATRPATARPSKPAPAATKPAPKADAPAPKAEPRRYPIVRIIAPGSTIDPGAKITRIVPNPKLPTAKNFKYFQALIDGHAAGLTVGETVAKHKDLPIVAEFRHAFEHGFVDLSVEPKHAKK